MNVFVNSLPKSGTNMVQKCLELASISYSGRSVAASSCFGKYELVKKVFRHPRIREVPVVIGLEVPVSVSPGWLSTYLRDAKGYVSGHAAYSMHLKRILANENYKVIQVVRHPGAVLSSWANYIAEPGYYWNAMYRQMAELDFEGRVESILEGGGKDGRFHYLRFRDVLAKIEEWLNSPEVLVIRYEDIVGLKGGGSDELQSATVRRIFEHINYEANNETIDYVVNNLYGGTHTFRMGSVHAWKDKVSMNLLDKIDEQLRGSPYLIRLGYEIKDESGVL